jgi:hypothetical protein
MNIFIVKRATQEVIARYEVHKAGPNGTPPPDEGYFDSAWERAVHDRLVEESQRSSYEFRMQLPKTLYETST